MERWWGPGWDGSLILSNNARPIPALSFDRTRTDPFESRWLSWLGPWDVSVLFGQMENDRTVPDARFFAFRFNFRPLPSLEIGLSRTAQWCGEGRPCDLDTFIDLLIGRDNRGGDGIGEDNEPGNQLAGFDARWTTALLDQPLAVYGQLIGEDEAGGFPSRYLAQAGMETRGTWKHRSYLLFLEVSGTSCDVLKDDINNCAYNHSIYQTGYRYRGRSVGHSADNDALIVSAGLVLQDAFDNEWSALLRSGTLNRGSFPDPRNSLTPNERDVISLDLYHNRRFRFGLVDVGVGITHFDGTASSGTQTDARLFLRWRSAR
jgi:hypothetical protein